MLLNRLKTNTSNRKTESFDVRDDLTWEQKSIRASTGVKVTALEAHGKYLFVGTARSSVDFLTVEAEDSSQKIEGIYRYTCALQFGKDAPVVKLKYDELHRVLFVLYQGRGLYVYNIDENIRSRQTHTAVFSENPNIQTFSLDKTLDNCRLVIGYGNSNKVDFYKFDVSREEDGGVHFQPTHLDSKVLEVPYSNFFFNDSTLICISKTGDVKYRLYKFSNNGKETIVQKEETNWALPKCKKILGRAMVIETNTVLLQSENSFYPAMENGAQYTKQEVQFYNAQFPAEVLDVALCFPYVTAICQKHIEIRNLYGPAADPSITSTRAQILTSQSAPQLIAGCQDRLYAVYGDSVHAWVPPFEKLSQSLMAELKLEGAAKHFKMLRSDQASRELVEAEVNNAKGFNCLSTGDIGAAFECFKYARQAADGKSSIPKLDVRVLLRAFSDKTGEPLDQVSVRDKEHGTTVISVPLYCKYTKDPEDFMGEMPERNDVVPLTIGYETKAKSQSVLTPQAFASVMLHKATNGLLNYLADLRQRCLSKLSHWVDDEEWFACDYALIMLYLRKIDADPNAYSSIEEIISTGCPLLFDEREQKRKRHELLVMYLYSFDLIRHAAMALAKANFHDRALHYLITYSKEEMLYAKYNCISDVANVLNMLSGSHLTSETCRKYITWLVTHGPSQVMRVLTADRKLPQDESKHHDTVLRKILPSYPNYFRTQYLKHLIINKRFTDEKYHTEYALSLIKDILQIQPKAVSEEETKKKQAMISKEIKLLDVKSELIELFTKPVLKLKAGTEKGVLGECRQALLQHLASKSQYDQEEVLSKLKETTLYEEQVELYKKKEQHQEALTVLLCKLEDVNAADEYCQSVFEESRREYIKNQMRDNGLKSESSVDISEKYSYNDLYIDLLRVWKRYDPKFQNQAIFEILKSRCTEIDPCKAIRELPEDVPTTTLQTFLSQGIMDVYHRYRTAQIKTNLTQQGNVIALTTHIKATNRKVVITDQTVCSFCSQKIDKSVFSVFPDGSIVHYKCLINDQQEGKKDMFVHPQSKHNFKKFPYKGF